MRLRVLIGLCLSLTTLTLPAKAGEFSQSRDLPPLKLAAADLDTILHSGSDLLASPNIRSIRFRLAVAGVYC